MKIRKLELVVALAILSTGALAAGQEMRFERSFPDEAATAQDVYLKFGAGLALDRAGNIWVVDAGQGAILQFDPAGRFLKKVGRPGQGPGEYLRPGTIHVAEDGDLLVLDPGNMRLAVLSGEGEFKRTIKLTRRYEDFCELKGRIYLVFNGPREDAKLADVLSLAGEPLGSLGDAPDFGPVAPYNIRIPFFKGISGDAKGRLWIGWNFFSFVCRLDPGPRGSTESIEIDDPKLAERSRRNRGELNKDKGEIAWVAPRIRALRDGFLALVPADRIEFKDCGPTGRVRATYWAPSPVEDYSGRDFVCRQDGRTILVYILQTRPETKVNVFRVESKSD